MREIRTCPICQEDFIAHQDTECCSPSCAGVKRGQAKGRLEDQGLLVDEFFSHNTRLESFDYYSEANAITRAMDEDEFNDVYGMDDNVLASKEQMPDARLVVRRAKRGGKTLIIIYECEHLHPKKHFHHFDYSKPEQVMRLCPSCHSQAHGKMREFRHTDKDRNLPLEQAAI
jgi:hypothetical protein